MALALGEFYKEMHFVTVSFKAMHCFQCIVKSCFLTVACLDVSEYLPVYLIPFGVLFFKFKLGKSLDKLLDRRYGSIQCWKFLFSLLVIIVRSHSSGV